MTNNEQRGNLNKASQTLTHNAGIVTDCASRVPENDDEANEQHVINGQAITDAISAADTAIGAIAWTD